MESEALVEKVGDRLVADARFELRRLAGMLDVEWDPGERAHNLNGLVTEILGRLPCAGDTVEWQGHSIEVLEATERQARKVAIRKTG